MKKLTLNFSNDTHEIKLVEFVSESNTLEEEDSDIIEAMYEKARMFFVCAIEDSVSDDMSDNDARNVRATLASANAFTAQLFCNVAVLCADNTECFLFLTQKMTIEDVS